MKNQRIIAVIGALFIAACGSSSTIGGEDSSVEDSAVEDSAVDEVSVEEPPCLRMIPLRLWVTDPSAVAMLYRIETCEGEGLAVVPGEGENVFDLYSLTENGESLSSEAVPVVESTEAQRVYVTLLLDYSGSTKAIEEELLESVEAFAALLLGESARIWIELKVFDGRGAPVTILSPTPDLVDITAALERLRYGSDPAADPDSTNLNGAVAAAVPALQDWQEAVMARNAEGVVTSGFVVIFTDGRDTANLTTAETAREAVATGRRARGLEGEKANVQTYAVALRGADFTENARASLLSILGGDERWLKEGTREELAAQFTELAATIASHTEATHLLKYCSASRAGEREVRLSVAPSLGEVEDPIVFTFESSGFSGGCAAFFETICEGKECGGFNCGGCDDRFEVCTDADLCEHECLALDLCDDDSLTSDLGYALTCGPPLLEESIVRCGAACVDTASDPLHCGACGAVCPTGVACIEGVCACPDGMTFCDGACRDPAYFESTAACGGCGNSCPTGVPCTDGECVCPSGTTLCDGACRDVSYFATPAACGGCGNICPLGMPCTSGACGCPSGTSFCDGACRPASYFESASDCGACGNTCAAGVPCTGGVCTCPSGTTFCDGACRPASYFESASDCGFCGNTCPAGVPCTGGVCACPSGTMLCDGACRPASYFETSENCGSCGNVCPSGVPCTGGACACPGGTMLCDGACRPASYFETSENCGTCGNVCASGTTCEAGQCIGVTCDAGHCDEVCLVEKTRTVELATTNEAVGWRAIDVTGDGHLDIVIIHQITRSVFIYPGDGTGQFGNVITISNVGRNHGDAAFGDFTGDGRMDIVVTQPDSSLIRLIRGGSSGFTLDPAISQTSRPYHLEAIDYNRDGNLDLLIYLKSSNCFVVRLGDGSGGFGTASSCILTPADSPLPYNTYKIVAFDWDGDGYDEIVEAHTSEGIRVWRTTGTGLTLLTQIPFAGTIFAIQKLELNGSDALAILSPDGDGDVTILGPTASGGHELRCAGESIAEPLTAEVGENQGFGSFIADIDEDGVPDRIWRLPFKAVPPSTIYIALP